jgi:hypothetical protein
LYPPLCEKKNGKEKSNLVMSWQEMAPVQQLFEEILHFLDPSEFEDRA